MADRLDTGTVWVGEIHIHGVMIPFGSHEQSGLGVENGVEGLSESTNTRTMMFRKEGHEDATPAAPLSARAAGFT